MAKEVAAKTANALATAEEEALAREYGGAGVSNKAADNIVPQIRILQPLSPEIVDGTLAGAQAGDFLMGSNLISGKEGFYFQPCFWDQRWFEFQPLAQGGGFAGTHEWLGENKGKPILPPGATAVDDFHFKMRDHELIHYRQWAGIAWVNGLPLERVINFKSTGHTVARNWNNVAREANRFSDGVSRPLFMHVYKLTTERKSNAMGTWFQLRVGPPVLLSQSNKDAVEIVGDNVINVVKMGAAVYNAFAGGQRKGEVDATVEPQQQQSSDVF